MINPITLNTNIQGYSKTKTLRHSCVPKENDSPEYFPNIYFSENHLQESPLVQSTRTVGQNKRGSTIIKRNLWNYQQ